MLLQTFGGIVGGGLLVLAILYLLEMRTVYKDKIVEGISGVQEWRTKLNALTTHFVTIGNEPLLARAASKTDDATEKSLSGQTQTLYRTTKGNYVALSYAYNCSSRAVQQVEANLRGGNALKAVGMHKATKLEELILEIKEINPEWYTRLLRPERRDPKAPVYSLEYLFNVCDKLSNEITSALRTIAETPAKVTARLATADKALAAAAVQYQALLNSEANYLPYDERVKAIAAVKTRVSSNISGDPLGALQLCNELDKAIGGLAQELEQAKQQLAAVNAGEQQLDATRDWVTKVRATAITCPWSDAPVEIACWSLSSPDSDPDGQLAQSATLLTQARHSLANGQLQAVSGECKQAVAARGQAEAMVKALFAAKTAVDEQVPQVRVKLAAIHGELDSITGGASTHEMAALVQRTCAAVEGRINEVHALYAKQRFPEALTLLTGTVGNEYGLPISKLLAQANELLKLLQQAAKVAGEMVKQQA